MEGGLASKEQKRQLISPEDREAHLRRQAHSEVQRQNEGRRLSKFGMEVAREVRTFGAEEFMAEVEERWSRKTSA